MMSLIAWSYFSFARRRPLKIIWALLDVVTIAVIGSGFHLWIARRTRKRGRLRHQMSSVAT
jgi:uncharacterized iron-regulated membrane protein